MCGVGGYRFSFQFMYKVFKIFYNDELFTKKEPGPIINSTDYIYIYIYIIYIVCVCVCVCVLRKFVSVNATNGNIGKRLINAYTHKHTHTVIHRLTIYLYHGSSVWP